MDIKNLRIGDQVSIINSKVGYKPGEKLIIIALDNRGLKPKVSLKDPKDSNVVTVNLEDIYFLE